ncbi:MAG: NADH-quinone oxidoreductase subunit N [Planctomycetales bacterium]
MTVSTTFISLLPEIILVTAGCLFILAGSFSLPRNIWGMLGVVVFAIAGVAEWKLTKLVALWAPPAEVDPGLVLIDPMSVLFQMSFLAIGALFCLAAIQDRDDHANAPEFYGLLLIVIAGLMLVCCANELILLFLGLELISIPMYVLLYLGRHGYGSQESAVKYFLLSVASAAVLLYGFCLLYGVTGSTNLADIRTILASSVRATAETTVPLVPSRMAMVSLVLILAGLGFKITAVPFHFYAPDVYQGTNAWNAGLLAVVPKAAGLIAIVRIVSFSLPGLELTGETTALIMALFTMTLGNVLALLQTNIRRMLAYSSIAHAGYMLVGISVGFWEKLHPGLTGDSMFGLPGGIQSSLFYLLAYSLVSTGLFAVLVSLSRGDRQVEEVEELTGLWKVQPVPAICAAIFLFSLAGIPPLPGFWGKLAVFASALGVRGDSATLIPLPSGWFVILAVVGVLNAAIGAVYYLRVIALMFLYDPPAKQPPRATGATQFAVVLATVATVWLGVQSEPLFEAVRGISFPGNPGQITQRDVKSAPVAQVRLPREHD